eukprot:gene717-4010_t
MKPLGKPLKEVFATLPNALIVPDDARAATAIRALSTAFASTSKQVHNLPHRNHIPRKLMTQGFDEEQIWAQVELLNDPLFERLSKLLDRNVNDLPQEKEHDTATLYEKEDKDDDEVAYEEAEGLDDETGNISLSSDNDQDGESEPEYSEFDATIDQEEQHAGHVEGKNVDEFDFRDDVDNDDDDDDDDDSVTMEDLKALSTFQKQQLELKQQIQVIEAENVAEKPWQLSGEADAHKRPENSLLEEFVEYEHLTAPPPIMTEETSHNLEEIIKQRIIDNIFDDVERRFDESMRIEAQKPEVSQEKSKLSLAEVYEQEFIETSHGAITSAAERRVQQQRNEVKQLMMTIEDELNALTNAHYVPMRPTEDLTIATKAPVISLEEVTPTAMANTTQQAPEEIAKKDKALISYEEASQTDRKRERRKKKSKQHHERIVKEDVEKQIESGKVVESAVDAKQRALTKLKAKAKQNEANITILDSTKSVDEQLAKNPIFRNLQREASQEADAIASGFKNKKAKRLSQKSGFTAFKL